MLAYNSRRNAPVCPKLRMIMPWNQEQISEGSKLQKIMLGSSPGEDAFSSSEKVR
jgi:hypothetical protein